MAAWFSMVVESLPIAIVFFLLVWWGAVPSECRRLRAQSRRRRKLDVILSVAANTIITGTVRFIAIVVLGAERVMLIGGPLAALLLVIVPGASAVVFWRWMNRRAPEA